VAQPEFQEKLGALKSEIGTRGRAPVEKQLTPAEAVAASFAARLKA
jgi:hypothetical protein